MPPHRLTSTSLSCTGVRVQYSDPAIDTSCLVTWAIGSALTTAAPTPDKATLRDPAPKTAPDPVSRGVNPVFVPCSLHSFDTLFTTTHCVSRTTTSYPSPSPSPSPLP